jgi:1-acyl-sn-glycerol-3-phosphate acyltransferase
VIVAAVRTVLTYIIVSLYVLITAPLGMLLALVFQSVDILYIFGHLGVQLALTLTGIKVHLSGAGPRDRAAVYFANHQSNVDPPILFHVLHRQMRVLYKRELDAIPLMTRAFRMGGFISVDRRNKDSAMKALDQGADSIRAGHSFLIFPEGTRSRTPELLPFKKGGFVMALKAHAPIVPVAVQGGRASMRKGSWLIWPAIVSVRVGEPIEAKDYSMEDRAALIALVRQRIEALLAEGPVPVS